MSMLSVSVLVDLEWSPRSGGHVLCWQRIAEAAAKSSEPLDLTVHVEGKKQRIVPLSPNVRFSIHRPVLGSSLLRFLGDVADHTDLAPFHPALFRALRRAQVIHTTDAHFAYAKTARLRSRLDHTALVTSLHTDTASYARIFASQVFRRIGHGGALAHRIVDEWHVPERIEARMRRTLARHLARSEWTLVAEHESIRPPKASILRRGIDKHRFHPEHRDRARLEVRFGVPRDRIAVVYAGRIDDAKCVMTAATACRALLDRGLDVHAIFAGEGPRKPSIHALLGPRATLTGAVAQAELAWLYASADLLAFPSRVEISPNVVLEAKASGLPVLVAKGGGDVFVGENGRDGLIVGDDDPAAWAHAIAALAVDPERREAMSRAARAEIETKHPSWEEVLAEDLLPVWKRVAKRA
jgi:glycosyltransferase involved in cell wall biosynthesis